MERRAAHPAEQASPMDREDTTKKTLVLLTGPPAVGKMTVGRELSHLTGLPLFHNHLSIEAVLPVFGFGDPAFNRVVTSLRENVISEVAESDLPGVIFTYVWAFDQPGDLRYVERLRDIFDSRGGRVVDPEMWADLETRLARNAASSRVEAKPSKRDVEASRKHLLEVEAKHQLSSGGDFPLSPHLWVDNSSLSPASAAERIADHFGLRRPPARP